MPTLNFHTKAQRRNVINMPSREPSPMVTTLHRDRCHLPGCGFRASARSFPSMTCSLGQHIAAHNRPSGDEPEVA